MLDHDFDRPFKDYASMEDYRARDPETAQKYGKTVKALEITNREYRQRFDKLADIQSMKPPPGSAIHIMKGFLVVRKLGTSRQYETWMSGNVFDELYVTSNPTSPSRAWKGFGNTQA
jgi:hypothetical protein